MVSSPHGEQSIRDQHEKKKPQTKMKKKNFKKC